MRAGVALQHNLKMGIDRQGETLRRDSEESIAYVRTTSPQPPRTANFLHTLKQDCLEWLPDIVCIALFYAAWSAFLPER
jgi:hypothetical protein